MGMESARLSSSKDKMGKLSAPPGFVSRSSFTLKRVDYNEESDSSVAVASSFRTEAAPMDTASSKTDIATFKMSFGRRPWMLFSQCSSNQEEPASKQLDKDLPLHTCLPKGVIRGCPDCNNCQKVTARWRPEAAHTTVLEDAPLFHPTEEEFGDTLKYIASIRSSVESYGICRIVPPSSWEPPCRIKEKHVWENSKFVTRIQRIDELQNDYPKREIAREHENINSKRRKTLKAGTEHGFESESTANPEKVDCYRTEGFGVEQGREFNLEVFKKSADEFKKQYFCGKNGVVNSNQWKPSIKSIEAEYWRIVENPTEEIEILYAADVETIKLGSGFPVVSNPTENSDYPEYAKSSWNLNNIPKLPGSLLSFENSNITGALMPQLYIGMCFSSLCWKAEEHHLYALWYLHLGAPKIWYCIPGKDLFKFQAAVKKYFPNLIGEQPELLYKLVRQLPLSTLKSEGIPVYSCIQYPGEFVLIFPGAYHSGFDCGFNCAEVGNFGPVDWLPHGQNAVELYCELGKRTSISHDKLLLGAANEAVKAQWELSLRGKNSIDNLRWKDSCGKDGILAKALKSCIKREENKRKYFCNSARLQKMDKSFGATSKRECSICLYDLYLSAASCPCSPDKYSCLIHAKQFCSCPWSAKIFLIRYEINELNILVEALEGKLSAVYKWAKEKLGLFLHSYVSKDGVRVPKLVGDISSSEDLKLEEHKPEGVTAPNGIRNPMTEVHLGTKAPDFQTKSLNGLTNREKTMDFTVISSGIANHTFSSQQEKPSQSSSGSTSGRSSSSCSSESEVGGSKFGFQLTRKERSLSASNSKASTCEVEKEVSSLELSTKSMAGTSNNYPNTYTLNNFCESDDT